MDTKNHKVIYVAEDDRYLNRILETILNKEGYKVKTAANGEELYNLTKKQIPDLILLDMIMPTKDGFETLAELKADGKLKDIKVVVLSNLGQSEDVDRAKELGASDYIVKADTSIQSVVDKVSDFLRE